MRRSVPVVWVLVALSLACSGWSQGVTNFDPKAYKGKTGKITVPYRGESAIVTALTEPGKRTAYQKYDSKDGTFVVPVGRHRVMMYYAYVRSGRTVSWSAAGRPRSLSANVVAGRSVSVNIGPPITASIKAQQMGKTLYLSLNMTGRGGEEAQINRVIGRGKAPGFQVLSQQGKVLMQGSFRYG